MDHEQHRGLAGLKLLKHLLGGPQDFSITDGAGNEASSVYTAAGAQISRLYSFNWVRLLRPFQTARGLFDRVGGGLAKLKRSRWPGHGSPGFPAVEGAVRHVPSAGIIIHLHIGNGGGTPGMHSGIARKGVIKTGLFNAFFRLADFPRVEGIGP